MPSGDDALPHIPAAVGNSKTTNNWLIISLTGTGIASCWSSNSLNPNAVNTGSVTKANTVVTAVSVTDNATLARAR